MRKLRVALVILLLLTFIVASNTVSAQTAISPKNMGDALSIGKSRATLQNIEKKLASGNMEIAKVNQEMGAYAKLMAARNFANVTKVPQANKTKSTIKPPSTKGYGVPMAGIGDAVKTLGGVHMKIMAPVEIAKSLNTPRLAILKEVIA